jgi:hypothetical protein
MTLPPSALPHPAGDLTRTTPDQTRSQAARLCYLDGPQWLMSPLSKLDAACNCQRRGSSARTCLAWRLTNSIVAISLLFATLLVSP